MSLAAAKKSGKFKFVIFFTSKTIQADSGWAAALRVQPEPMPTYNPKPGFTRLRLTGNKVLEVREATDQFDRLIRFRPESRQGDKHKAVSAERKA